MKESIEELNNLLKEYRHEINEATRSILDLVAARQSLSLRIAETKKKLGKEVENPEVEKKLISDVKNYSKQIGLNPEIAESLVLRLIDASKLAQREKLVADDIKTSLHLNGIQKITIVGAGRMGMWFAKYFQRTGIKITLIDKNKKRARERARELGCGYSEKFDDIPKSDLLILAVPIVQTSNQIQKLFEYAASAETNRRRPLKVVEISSIKNGIRNLLDRIRSEEKIRQTLEFYSIHPLFGKRAEEYAENSIIQVYPRNEVKFVHDLFPHFRVYLMDTEMHDELMSLVLTLPHALALVFADLLYNKWIRTGKMPRGLKSPSFNHMLELSRRVLEENPDVYYEIQKLNPYNSRAYEDAISSVQSLQSLMNEKQAFRRLFENMSRGIEDYW